MLDPRWCAPVAPAEVEAAVEGRRIERLRRRGKYLIWELDEEIFLLMHLRMTGTLLLVPADEGEGRRHIRARLALRGAGLVLFSDPRRFGTGMVVAGEPALDEYLDARLGPEPLDPEFTPEVFAGLARGRRAPVKSFLLTQARVAGVGNIYADEALFRARIHPLRPAGKLRRAQIEDLHAALIEALAAGIDARGASIDDFRDPDGVSGSFQNEFLVHRRAGEPCPRCARPIRKIRAAGRGTYVCERCQPRPRARRRA